MGLRSGKEAVDLSALAVEDGNKSETVAVVVFNHRQDESGSLLQKQRFTFVLYQR